MTLLLDMMFALVGGFGGHLTRPLLRKHFFGGWFPLSCYAVGFTIVTIFGAAIIRKLDVKDISVRYVATNFLTGLAVGVGVGMGHLVEPDE